MSKSGELQSKGPIVEVEFVPTEAFLRVRPKGTSHATTPVADPLAPTLENSNGDSKNPLLSETEEELSASEGAGFLIGVTLAIGLGVAVYYLWSPLSQKMKDWIGPRS